MGAKKQTVGYKYYFSLHMGIGRGPLNEIAEIQVGGVTALDEPICLFEGGQLVLIDKPELFGGEQKEGGIEGLMYAYNGAGDQELQGDLTFTSSSGKDYSLPAIATSLGGDVPSFRGITTLWYDGLVAALNPYPKEWSFRVRRTTAGWFEDNCWYQARATINMADEDGNIIRAMNGSHILYEVNTNPEWGRGMPAEMLDENSYIKAANTLCNEGFGLCIPWFRQESIKEFIPIIIDHIGGVQYLDRQTGLMTLRLIRDDYDPDLLPVFTPDTGLLDIIDDDSSGEDTSYNEIIIEGFDPVKKEAISVRVQNLAAIQNQGEIVSNTIQYKGAPTRALLTRLAIRELRAQLPLRRMTAVFDRRAWKIAPGMPFKISFPDRNIDNMIMRAGEVFDGTLTNGKIEVKCAQDIFGMPLTTYVVPPTSQWTAPSFDAVVSPETRLMEVNYRDYYIRSEPADRDALDAGTSYIAEVAKAPAGVQSQGYDLATKAGSEAYDTYVNGGFTAWLTLTADIGPLDTSLTVDAENRTNFLTEFEDGMVITLDDEQISFTTFDGDTGIATIERGVADTIPASHTAGATIWLTDDEMVSDGREYADGETVYAKALTRTSSDLLDLADAVEDSIVVDQRVFRPYPPGDVKQGGTSVYLPRGEETEPVLTWAHRDRVIQGDTVVGHADASVGPETGTVYRVRVYDADGVTLLNTYEDIDAATWTYDTTMQAADGSPSIVWMELESVRDGLASYFFYRFRVVITGGWGYDWGNNWGGV